MNTKQLPLPSHYEPDQVNQVWRVPYQERALDAIKWARRYQIAPATNDRLRTTLLLVDVQNTFCIPDFELFVKGAVEDNQRLCEFIYRNLHLITEICPTLDTHQAAQIFHALFLIDDRGHHPEPYTLISTEDIQGGRWRFNPQLAISLGISPGEGQDYLIHYVNQLALGKKYELTVWPYHAMLGGIGHALVASVEEALFFHTMARTCQPDFQVKGRHPLTENYSVLKPEVLQNPQKKPIAHKNTGLLQKLLKTDRLIIAGQAKSHCVAWTIADLLDEIEATNPALTSKVYLLMDSMSPVVIPGVVDYGPIADAAFERYFAAGMHPVLSTDAINTWPAAGHR